MCQGCRGEACERVILRPIRAEDATQVFAAIDESREHLRPWLSWVDQHITAEETHAIVARCAAN